MSCGVGAVDVGDTAEADILSGTADDLRAYRLAVFIIADDIRSVAVNVLTGAAAADSNIMS